MSRKGFQEPVPIRRKPSSCPPRPFPGQSQTRACDHQQNQRSHGNPFAFEGSAIYNLITHAYIPDEYVPQILNIDDTGQKLYIDYVSERINGDVSLWDPVKQEKNLMYMSGNKKHTVKVRDKTVDLKEIKDLYGRLMVLAR